MRIKSVMAFVFGGSLGIMIHNISDYSLTDWQFWAAWLPVLIIGIIFAETD